MGEKYLPMVSIVVINFKSIQQLEKCLRYLERTRYPNYELIVVDCLTKGVDAWIKKFYPNVKLIHYDHDIGASASHNVDDFLDKNSKYIAFLDNDAYVTEEWLMELVKVMENDENVGVAQAKIVRAKNPGLLDHVGMAIDAFGTWLTLQGFKADSIKNISEIFVASSAGCIVRRNLFKMVRGFDPDYFIYDDDTDFSFRIRLLGYKIIIVPSSIIFHEGEPTRSLIPRKLYHSIKNRMCTMIKNYEFRHLWWRLTIYMISVFMAGVCLFLIRRFLEAREVLRSLLYPLVNLRKLWIKRALIQSKRVVRDSEFLKRGFILNNINPTIQDMKTKLVYVSKSKP
ncbi:MAG: glycosyltransferase family 2 protein [Candidatus Methanomethylicia archaeon]